MLCFVENTQLWKQPLSLKSSFEVQFKCHFLQSFPAFSQRYITVFFFFELHCLHLSNCLLPLPYPLARPCTSCITSTVSGAVSCTKVLKKCLQYCIDALVESSSQSRGSQQGWEPKTHLELGRVTAQGYAWGRGLTAGHRASVRAWS